MLKTNAYPFTVGLTGGIASGKTTVSQLFETYGVRIIDTDVIAHQLTCQNGLALPMIAKAFGNQFIDQNTGLNRIKMRELVFNNPNARIQLESILHPMIQQEVLKQSARPLIDSEPYLMWVIPLLIQKNGQIGHWKDKIDQVLLVDCPESSQLTRLMKRSGLTLSQAQAILNAQASRAQRIVHADHIVSNDGDVLSLSHQVQVLHEYYLKQVRNITKESRFS